ncbi:hypothetical protein VTG60DRAFT_3860 [Thermothelomyces hinnuleus]
MVSMYGTRMPVSLPREVRHGILADTKDGTRTSRTSSNIGVSAGLYMMKPAWPRKARHPTDPRYQEWLQEMATIDVVVTERSYSELRTDLGNGSGPSEGPEDY